MKLNSKLSSSSTNGNGNNVGTVNTTTNKVEKVS